MFLDDKIVQAVIEFTHRDSSLTIDSSAVLRKISEICYDALLDELLHRDPRVDQIVSDKSAVNKICRLYDSAVDKLNKMGIYFIRKGGFKDALYMDSDIKNYLTTQNNAFKSQKNAQIF